METVRRPAVAGMFYPDDPEELRAQIQSFLAQTIVGGSVPKAIIAPHAGYIYSGSVAASA
jgi:AmmeMemoRadiSam system protein B